MKMKWFRMNSLDDNWVFNARNEEEATEKFLRSFCMDHDRYVDYCEEIGCNSDITWEIVPDNTRGIIIKLDEQAMLYEKEIRAYVDNQITWNSDFSGILYIIRPDYFTCVECKDELSGSILLDGIQNVIATERYK